MKKSAGKQDLYSFPAKHYTYIDFIDLHQKKI